jgi:hypothetical protein
MKSHDRRKVADVSHLWISAGVVLSLMGFLPVVLAGNPQLIIMGVFGLIFVGVGIYGKRSRGKFENTPDS